MNRHLLSILLFLALAATLRAADAPDAAMERFRRGTFDTRTLVEILPRLADPAQRPGIRSALTEAKAPPLQDLVGLLGHPLLAVRLGSLEILEELAGGDFSYNPWAPAGSPENAAALERWRKWAKDPVRPKSGALFSEDQRRAYLQDILGDDADKSARARRMLEAEGLPAVGFLEDYLLQTPALPAGLRARIREAQYQIALSRQLGDQAAVTARNLAFGSRDQILSALATVRGAGLLALPILHDFIDHPDPLVRETAIDAMLVTGGAPAVAIVGPILKKEPDVNVVHGALRRLKDVPGDASRELVTSFLASDDEDLLISAIQTSLSLAGGDSDRVFSTSKKAAAATPADKAVLAALSDKRWRVRAAALEYVAKRQLASAKDACVALLADPDDFVRFAAIKAIAAMKATPALPKLKAIFLKDEEMTGPVFEGYGALNVEPDGEMLARLDAASPEAKLAALRAVESSEKLRPLAIRYAIDADTDVACAALRLLAADQETVAKNEVASALVAALRSGSPEKQTAVMERLQLPKSKRIDPRVLQALDSGLAKAESTALDGLYAAFAGPGKKDDARPQAPVLPQAQEALVSELEKRIGPDAPAAERFRAALALAAASYPAGYEALERDLPALTTAQKTAICEAADSPSVREGMPVLAALIRDPISEVRAAAASAALSNDDAPAFAALVLDELVRPDTPLRAHEVYSYRYESIARSRRSGAALRNWATRVLDSAGANTPLRVLAAISLRGNASGTALAALRTATGSADPLVRRAAWQALLTARPREIAGSADKILADSEAFVRIVLPMVLNADDDAWMHRFSDLDVVRDSRWSSDSNKPRMDAATKEQLEKLAIAEPAPRVRFETLFALLVNGATIDVDAFVALVPAMPEDASARSRITRWLGKNAARATPGLAPLLAVIEPGRIDADKMAILTKRIQPAREEGFATFAALAKSQPAPAGGDLLAPEAPTPETAARTSLEVVYFFKPGCPECAQVKRYLDAIEPDFPLLNVTGHNILETAGTVYNQALCERFHVPAASQTLSPAIFCQGGFLVREAIDAPALARLLSDTMALPQDDSWMKVDAAGKAAAAQTVEQKFAAFTLPVVVGAGLLDGVNPCAFATIIFFLSYLQIARRTPREMLMVGAAFISAVFLAYFAAGLVLYQFLAAINDRFAGVQRWMNFGFAGLAMLAAALSFRDAWRARGGRLDEMTLQLPGFMKSRIRGVIRTGARARNFVIAAFVSGIVISLLELACTGQVYAPIIYQIQQGRLDAVLWLAIYNVAFILPLIAIFLLAYGGLRSETLIAVQKKHTAAVKAGLGLVFLALAAVILVSGKWLG